jgi:uncharacterized protein
MTILERTLKNDAIQSIEGSMVVTSQYTAGLGGEAFLRGIQDHEELLASHCKPCKKWFLPTRLFCERCLSRLTDIKPVGPEGKIKSVTHVHVDLDGNRLDSPQYVGLIEFKGVEGGIVHILSASNEKKLRVGEKVKAVFKPKAERTGSVLDICWFSVA